MAVETLAAPVHLLSPVQAFRWLADGWRDLQRAPLPGLLHGLLFLVGALAIVLIGWGRYSLLAGAFSGFLLVCPMLAAGLYETSRRLQRGERPMLRDLVRVWIDGGPCMVRLGLLLAVLGALWVGLSTAIILGSGAGTDAGVASFIRHFVLSPNWLPFTAWLLAGGLFAALVFAICAVSVPMLLDREVSLFVAILTSVRAVGNNPLTMIVWAALVMMLTLLSLVLVLPMVVLVPLLGHATWHAYADSVDASAIAPRIL